MLSINLKPTCIAGPVGFSRGNRGVVVGIC